MRHLLSPPYVDEKLTSPRDPKECDQVRFPGAMLEIHCKLGILEHGLPILNVVHYE